jgi:subtilisin family serine protease
VIIDPDLRERAREQEEQLATMASDADAANATLASLVEAHQDPRADDPYDVRVQPIVAPGGNLAEGLLVVADQLLVWDRDLHVALDALAQGGFAVAQVNRHVTPRVSQIVLQPPADPDPNGERLAEASELVRARGLRVSFEHCPIANDYTPLKSFVTAKGDSPPIAAVHYELPPLPRRRPFETSQRTVKVAVVDGGIDFREDVLSRDDGRLAWVVAREVDQDPGAAGMDPLQTLGNGTGHGSAVAGVVELVAPFSRIRMFRALSGGIGSEVAVADSIRSAVRWGADIVNLSLGQHGIPEDAPLSIEDALFHVPDHVLVVAAAGNSGSFGMAWPAGFKRVIAVGATDVDNEPALYSNRGCYVDFSACGTVATPFVHGTIRPYTNSHGQAVGGGTFDGSRPIAVATGTSFAAPLISGALANMLARGMGAADAVANLKASGEAEPDFGYIVDVIDQ